MFATLLFGGLLIAAIIKLAVCYAIDEIDYCWRKYKRHHGLDNHTRKAYVPSNKQSGSLPQVPITDFLEKDEDKK